MTHQRRYDIDWLRVIAIGLLLIYHVVVGFQPWGVFIGFIQNDKPLESVWIPMSMLNVWRIPFLFMVSGMGVSFALRRRNWKQLIGERTQRILIPFLFGTLAIVPLHVFLWQDYYHQEIAHNFNPYHLWFLGNIFVYVLILSPVFFLLKRNENGKFQRIMTKLLGTPVGLALIIGLFIAESYLVKPDSFEYYAMNLHGFVLGMICFFFGFLCVYSGERFWNFVSRYRWILLGAAFTLYLIRLVEMELVAPFYYISVESCLWIFSVFGMGHKYLNKPSDRLTYLSEAAYPIYIVHMLFIYLGSYLLFDLGIDPWLKLIAILIFTFAGCFLTYEFLIRRVPFLRPLFGLKMRKSSQSSSIKRPIPSLKAGS